MKKKLSVVVLICIIFSLLCGCTSEIPKFYPSEHDKADNFVWVCKEPFAYFTLDIDKKVRTSPCLKGCFEKDGELPYFYLYFMCNGGSTDFCEVEKWENTTIDSSFWGYADYFEDYFDFKVEKDNINFFDGALPTLRFEKMTKEAFLKEYGEEKFGLLFG